MLLGGVVLFAALAAASISRARGAVSGISNLQVRSALESAVHATAFELLKRGQAAGGVPQTRVVTIGELAVSVEVVDQDGLLDVNKSSAADLAVVLRALELSDPESRAAVIVSARPLTSLGQLTQVLEAATEPVDCLSSMLTFSSGLARPDSRLAPVRLVRLLSLASPGGGQEGIGAPRSGSGLGYLIRAQTSAVAGQGGAIAAAVVVSGRTDAPLRVMDWYWQSSGALACPWPG